jgi:hypothetical protein
MHRASDHRHLVPPPSRVRAAVKVPVLTLLVLVLAFLFAGASATAGGVPVPKLPEAQGEQCVEEPDYMRRNHGRLLNHRRDTVVHEGVREPAYKLQACIDCHVQPSPTGEPVRGRDHFCGACHTYAAVKVDCFQCHSSQPSRNTAFHPIVTPRMEAVKELHEGPSTAELLNRIAESGAAQEPAQ